MCNCGIGFSSRNNTSATDSLLACNKNGCVSKANGPIALKIDVDVSTRLVYAPMKYDINRTPGSRHMGFGSRWPKFAENVPSG